MTIGGWAHRYAQRQLLDDVEVDRWNVASQSERGSWHWTVGDLGASPAGLLGRSRDFLGDLELGACLAEELYRLST